MRTSAAGPEQPEIGAAKFKLHCGGVQFSMTFLSIDAGVGTSGGQDITPKNCGAWVLFSLHSAEAPSVHLLH